MCVLLVFVICLLVYVVDLGQVVVLYVQYSYLYDDNVLCLSGFDVVVLVFGVLKLFDLVQSWIVGLKLDCELSCQYVMLDVSVIKNMYDYFLQFDNDVCDLKINWSWFLGECFLGDIGYVYFKLFMFFQNFWILGLNICIMQIKYVMLVW